MLRWVGPHENDYHCYLSVVTCFSVLEEVFPIAMAALAMPQGGTVRSVVKLSGSHHDVLRRQLKSDVERRVVPHYCCTL